jgi:hypothetical protein
MPAYTGTFNIYNAWSKNGGDSANHSTDTFKIILCTSSYTPSQSGHSTISDITNEVSGSGYARATLANVVFTRSAAVTKFSADAAVFTASGGSITARYFVIFDDTPTSPADPLVGYGLIDANNLDVVTTNGNTLTITPNAAGYFTSTRA